MLLTSSVNSEERLMSEWIEKKKVSQVAEAIRKAAQKVGEDNGVSPRRAMKEFCDGLLRQARNRKFGAEYDPANDPSHPMRGWRP